MGKRLVLRSEEGKILLSDLRAFVKKCDEYNLPNGTELDSQEDITLQVSIPRDLEIVKGKRVKVKGKTANGRKVEEQIENHKQEKAEGEGPGYVPPVGRKRAPKVQRFKCPVCGNTKHIVTISGVKQIKPHLSKGQPCKGGGIQLVGTRTLKPVSI